ncbi:single-stranded DNA-binding protein [Amycolatopsis sp. NPDC059090]|uniref:single-stranded DNA-binding protein n=1 Tax=unclassified Amycolatopsis TaxID=2618356 RepID=UPI00366FA463
MAGGTAITAAGNLTSDQDLRFTPSGAPVADFTVASTCARSTGRPACGRTATRCFLRCNIWWRALAIPFRSIRRLTWQTVAHVLVAGAS